MNNLAVLTNNNERVLLTKQLADIYEASEKNINDNFSNNKDRFIEGIHYYLLKGQELKDFKNSLPESIGEPLKYAPKLILWTEKGASRHSKILDTDMAWKRFDELEDTYFKVKEQHTYNIKNEKKSNNYIAEAKEQMELLAITSNVLNLNDSSKLKIAHRIYKDNGISTGYLPEYTTSKGDLLSATELLKRNNIDISTQAFNKLLLNNDVLEEKERPSKSKGVKKFKSIKNAYYGENVLNEHGSSQETQPLLYKDKFHELLQLVKLV